MTAEIVNLNKIRKARERALREKQAHENRIRYGQSKADRNVIQAEQRRSQAELEGAKRDGERKTDASDVDPNNVS